MYEPYYLTVLRGEHVTISQMGDWLGDKVNHGEFQINTGYASDTDGEEDVDDSDGASDDTCCMVFIIALVIAIFLIYTGVVISRELNEIDLSINGRGDGDSPPKPHNSEADEHFREVLLGLFRGIPTRVRRRSHNPAIGFARISSSGATRQNPIAPARKKPAPVYRKVPSGKTPARNHPGTQITADTRGPTTPPAR